MVRKIRVCVRLELPPRARRIRAKPLRGGGHAGTTSACAENTPPAHHGNPRERNYLRVRGEYNPIMILCVTSMELPPRARRIPLVFGFAYFEQGTTSACAENTLNELGLL